MTGNKRYKLVGPFKEALTMRKLPLKGALKDSQLEIINNAGLLIEGNNINAIDAFETLAKTYDADIIEMTTPCVVLPGFVDMHTHIAFGGNRANDFALRNAGCTYLEIAEAGGGIWSTVKNTRSLSQVQLAALTAQRAQYLLQQGVTTIEVKSGYGLSVDEELKTLRAIKETKALTKADLIATCLAAHTLPKDFNGNHVDYLNWISNELLPILKREQLTDRIDAFIEKSAFSTDQILPYYEKAISMGFDITVHADQFTPGGSTVAVKVGALSADHLEASGDKEIQMLSKSNVIAGILPGASMGLGCAFAPARKLLDAGAAVAIGTDWNPGSAPMGQLMTQASVLACFEKLSNAELLAAITFRAAAALNLKDRGVLDKHYKADFTIYNTNNYKEITWQQGSLHPLQVWKNGECVIKQA